MDQAGALGAGITGAADAYATGQQQAGQAAAMGARGAGEARAQNRIAQANILNNLIGQGAQLYGLNRMGFFG